MALQLESSLPSPERLETILQDALPTAKIVRYPVGDGHYPILIFESNNSVVGFSGAEGDSFATDYQVGYEKFKSVFLERQLEWSARARAFVWIVSTKSPDIQRFCAEVETDTLFCRKFVLNTSGGIEVALASLPFLPLAPISSGNLRPPSALKLMLSAGIHNLLASSLATQGARAPEGLVQDCLDRKFGLPTDIQHGLVGIRQDSRQNAPVRLRQIHIERFRAYKKRQVFDLGSGVTVLYGANGFGKTSFFDAIDFVATGGIGRLARVEGNEVAFRKVAQHLDAPDEAGEVGLVVDTEEGPRRITRQLSNRKFATLDGISADRKQVLALLTGGQVSGSDRIESFVNLFRATHLFSQEHQELTRDFGEDCEIPNDTLSRMLAFEDYVAAVGKVHRVREALRLAEDRLTKERAGLAARVEGAESEIERLSPLIEANGAEASPALDLHRQQILHALVPLGLEHVGTLRSLTEVREARGHVQAELEQTKALAEALAVAPSLLENLSLFEGQLERSRLQVEVLRQAEQLIQGQVASAATEVAAKDGLLARARTRVRDANGEVDLWAWAAREAPPYFQDREDEAHLKASKLKAEADVAELDALRKTRLESLSDLEAKHKAAETLEQSLIGRQAQLRPIGMLVSEVRSRTRVRGEIERNLAQRESKKGELELQLREVEVAVRSRSDSVKSKEAEVAKMRQLSSRVAALVSELTQFAKTGECPACGANHGSTDELLSHMKDVISRASTFPIDDSGLQTAKDDLERDEDRARTLRTEIASIDADISHLRKELVESRAWFDRFATEAVSTGLHSADEEGVERAFLVESTEVTTRLSATRAELADLTDRLSKERRAVSDASEDVQKKIAEISRLEKLSAACRDRITKFSANAAMTRIPLDVGVAGIEAQLGKLREKLLQLKADLDQAASDAEKARSDSTASRSALEAAQRDVKRASEDVTRLEREIASALSDFVKLGFAQRPELGDIDARILATGKRQEQLVDVYKSLESLELTLDAVTTAAALSTWRATLQESNAQIAVLDADLKERKGWARFFKAVEELLEHNQEEAIASFVANYGQRTGLIQKRLRAVYGFDDIKMSTTSGAVKVRATRNGVDLRPNDFFSQSQQQTLLLGLFLTACSSQTWSGFAPVFLDDPVTHFDDLNTYAFLDLVLGFVETDFDNRQFIISTCDEKLLLLARQKFAHLGPKAVFYRFEAIGSDGPFISRLPT